MAIAWLNQQDVENYGHDVLDLAQRAALHALAPDLQALNHASADLRAQLAHDRTRALYQTLNSSLPNWQEIDSDPRFREWLMQPHELSGRPRQMHLNDAIQAADAARVASFFRGFLAEAGQSPQQPQHAPSTPTGKPTYTRAQITQAANDFVRGRTSQAEYERLARDMHAALAEGRLVGPMPMRGLGKTRF